MSLYNDQIKLDLLWSQMLKKRNKAIEQLENKTEKVNQEIIKQIDRFDIYSLRGGGEIK